MEELSSQWTDFRNVLCWGLLFVEKIKVLSKSDKKLYMKTAVLVRKYLPEFWEVLKLGGEAMISQLARLLDITLINNGIPGDWKRSVVVPNYKGGDRSVVRNYRPVSLTSVVCKKTEHV